MTKPDAASPAPPSSSSSPPAVDLKSGFCSETRTFRSLRPPILLPPSSLPLSFPSFALSLLPSPLPSNPALLSSSTAASLSYPDLLSQVRSLSSSLSLSRGDVAFILSASSIHLPVLYLSLLSLGVVVCPANPLSTQAEISRQCDLVAPVSVAFATSSAAPKLPPHLLHTPKLIILDSPQFHSLLFSEKKPAASVVDNERKVLQSDAAAIQFSSGTTGRVKAASLAHRGFIAMAATAHQAPRRPTAEVTLLAAPMFHSLGFAAVCMGIALGNTTVVMEGPGGFGKVMRAAAERGATTLVAAPPVVVAMARSAVVDEREIGSLETVVTGGAPLPAEVAGRFMARFPGVQLRQGYGSTEGGPISNMISNEECSHLRSVGRLGNVEAKIVDVNTGKALSVAQQGEIYIRGPAVMIGYVGDFQANESTFDSEGWLKTGDLCYFDNEGYLYIVDRLKELIKYKAYQVAPAELEHLLHSIPDVLDAAVVPYPQEDVGQIPLAFVVRQPGSNLSETQIMDYVAKQVAPYKKIRKVLFINSIPKSATGKALRKELATHALGGSRL